MIDVPQFKGPLTTMLREVFGLSDRPTGYFLDSGESGLLGLTKEIDAATASASYLPGHETIAGHCGHVLYTLDLFLTMERGEGAAVVLPRDTAETALVRVTTPRGPTRERTSSSQPPVTQDPPPAERRRSIRRPRPAPRARRGVRGFRSGGPPWSP